MKIFNKKPRDQTIRLSYDLRISEYDYVPAGVKIRIPEDGLPVTWNFKQKIGQVTKVEETDDGLMVVAQITDPEFKEKFQKVWGLIGTKK